MKRYLKIIILVTTVIVVLVVTNYKTMLLWYFDIKEPKVESCETIKKYLKNKNWDFGQTFIFKDSLLLSEYFKKNPNIPDAKFFNNERKFINYKETPESCNAGVKYFLKSLDSTKKSNKFSRTLEEELLGVVNCSTFKSISVDSLKYDYYVVFYWAKFIGDLNKTKVFDWKIHIDNLNKDKPGTIKAIYVNCDSQKF